MLSDLERDSSKTGKTEISWACFGMAVAVVLFLFLRERCRAYMQGHHETMLGIKMYHKDSWDPASLTLTSV